MHLSSFFSWRVTVLASLHGCSVMQEKSVVLNVHKTAALQVRFTMREETTLIGYHAYCEKCYACQLFFASSCPSIFASPRRAFAQASFLRTMRR